MISCLALGVCPRARPKKLRLLPSEGGVQEAVELLRSRFGEPPFLPQVRALRALVKTLEECPDYASLSRLLLPLATEDLVLIAAAVSEEIPIPRWSALQRSTVVAALHPRT